MKEKFADFAKEHPFLTYFVTRSTIAIVCGSVVDVVRAVTGHYPPTVPLYTRTIIPDGEETVEEPVDIEEGEEVEIPVV